MKTFASFTTSNYSVQDGFVTVLPVNEKDFTESDYKKIVKVCNQKEIYSLLFKERLGGKSYKLADAKGFVNWATKGWETKEYFVFIVRNQLNQIVGAIDIKSNNLDLAEVGYWMDKDSPGYMTNVLIGLACQAKDFGFKKLYGLTKINNDKSKRVLLRAKFLSTGKYVQNDCEYDRFEIVL